MESKDSQNQAKFMALTWWQRMFLSANELKKLGSYSAPTSFKAQLKRCNTLDAVMLSEGFRDLWLSLPEDITAQPKPETVEAWAAVAAVLVFVKTNTQTKLASAAGKKDGDKSVVSELRFAQLQNAHTGDEFVTRLRRMLQQLDGKVSVQGLINDVLKWFREHYSFRPQRPTNRLAVQWAMDYYQSAK